MNDEKRIEIGLKLKNAREYLEISQEEAAKAADVPRSAISLIESGQRKLDSVELSALASLYQQPTAYFLGETKLEESDTDLGFLARSYTNLSDADKQELVRFAEFLAIRGKSK